MKKKSLLSLPTAIIININVMVGAGIFMNTVNLAKLAGIFGCLLYLVMGTLMLPLILSISELLRLHPPGGFYTYARKEISPLAGFLSAWGYFVGKLGSGAIVLHTAVLFLQSVSPWLQKIPSLVVDLFIIIIFMLLNMLNMQTSGKIQTLFVTSKIIPLTIAICIGFFFFGNLSVSAFSSTPELSSLLSALPIVLFATIGFEVACSISRNIENPTKNAPKAVLISYGIAIFIATLFQTSVYAILGSSLAEKTSYLEVFPAIIGTLFHGSQIFTNSVSGLIHLILGISALGGSYGIMFSNGWNLYMLAQNKHVFGSRILTFLNKHGIPAACVILEGLIYILYLLVSWGEHITVTLQQIGALGTIFAYLFSVLALLVSRAKNKYNNRSIWLPLLGFINCTFLLSMCIRGLIITGATSLITLLTLISLGAGMYWFTSKRAVSEF